ncbi:hypothetical protein GX563_10910 [Candidatus Bathyarchaeota archaeon]|nr:hypothetical protein [Candidatus Bathyarchaeota archaeon]
MGNNVKKLTISLIVFLVASNLTFVSTVSGQSLKPVVTEFSLQYIDNSYDVPTSYKYTKDLYTGETITTTIPGYRVDNKSLVATIKNPTGVDAYNFRWKPHNESRWYYHPFDTEAGQTPPLSASGTSGPPAYASDTDYTVIIVLSLNRFSATSLDVQVQALYGEYHAVNSTPIQIFEGDYYDYYFDGQASYWSNTQTITISSNPHTQNTPIPTPTSTISPSATQTPITQTPTPTTTENPVGFDLMQTTVVVLTVVVVILAVVIVLVFRNYRKPR